MWEEGGGEGRGAMRLGRRGEGCAEATWRGREERGAQRSQGGSGEREGGEGELGLVVVSV